MKQGQVKPDARLSNLITINISGMHVLMAVQGAVYLLHFERAYYGHMRHYVGFTADDLEARLERHREGKGGKTTRRAFDKRHLVHPGSHVGRRFAEPGTPDQIEWPGQLLPALPSKPGQRHCPVQPDRCQCSFRGRSQSGVSAVCARIGDATIGSALDGDLSR